MHVQYNTAVTISLQSQGLSGEAGEPQDFFSFTPYTANSNTESVILVAGTGTVFRTLYFYFESRRSSIFFVVQKHAYCYFSYVFRGEEILLVKVHVQAVIITIPGVG